METTKIHINSTISTPGAKYAAGDISNMYTNSRLESPEYMKINIRDITEEVIDKYELQKYVASNRYVYFAIHGAIYGLKISGQIAFEDLKKNLSPHGYYPSKRTPCCDINK